MTGKRCPLDGRVPACCPCHRVLCCTYSLWEMFMIITRSSVRCLQTESASRYSFQGSRPARYQDARTAFPVHTTSSTVLGCAGRELLDWGEWGRAASQPPSFCSATFWSGLLLPCHCMLSLTVKKHPCGLLRAAPAGASAQASAVSLAGLNSGDPSSAAKVLLLRCPEVWPAGIYEPTAVSCSSMPM